MEFEDNVPLDAVDDLAVDQTAATGAKAKSVHDVPDRGLTSANIDLILDIPIEVSVELGRTKMKIQEVSVLEAGASIILSNAEGEPLDILANGRLIAKGEVVVENGRYGIRITEVVNRMKRIKSLG